MPGTTQMYVEAAIAFALMVTIAIITGFVAVGATGDRALSLSVAFVMFVATGAVLAVRIWRMSRA